MFGAILKATNSSFQKGMTFCRSVYVKKVMKLLAFIFEQPSYIAENPAWSAWSSWMACSVSCGSGTQSRNRTCLDSTPGNTCQGNMTETSSCSQPACAGKH